MKNATFSVNVVILLILTLSAHQTQAAMICVPEDYATIQGAIDAAGDGDLVLVAMGTYFENIECAGKSITLQGDRGAEVTVIDGSQSGSTVTIDGGDAVQPVIDGFTIRNGTGTWDAVTGGVTGGGIYCLGSSYMISNCDIVENQARTGGGIYTRDTFSATIADCRISGNISEHNGAGVVFGNDRHITIKDCLVSENSSGHDGGGIWCNAAPGTISNCRITGNSTASDGAGITVASDSTPTILNCIVDGNTGNGYGGGMYSLISPTIVQNCTFSDNEARHGGGICYSRASNALVVNSILWANHASTGHSEIYHYGSSYAEVSYSDVQGGWPGEGNFVSEPMFYGSGDYHLMAASPCIDSGTDAGVYTDIDGDIRPLGNGFDIGADEYSEGCWDIDEDGYSDVICGGEDCDDTDPEVNPGAVEICDGKDNDCDGLIDEGFEDAAGDGFAFCVDCDDTDPEVNPDALEVCDDKDNDCDGLIDEEPECVVLQVPDQYATIQDAIEIAESENTILVSPGIYRENIDFMGKNVKVHSEDGPIKTIIDGGRAGSVVAFSSGETEEAVLDGFTIQNGSGTFITLPYLGAGFYTGGGIFCGGTAPTITNCMITNNYAYLGGGLYLRDSSPTLTNCMIVRNRATGLIHGGGGIYLEDSSPTITNCTVGSNYAGQYGGGIFCWSSSPTITNSILWGDFSIYDPEIHVRSGSPVITYSDVEGGWSGVGNIEANPSFVGGVTFHLRPGSPCVDSGTDAGIYTDMDGQRRPWGTGFDMGADEFSTEPCSVIASSGGQFCTLYLIPILAFVFWRRRRMIKK